jgi:TonB-dependent SusC/RagA subfamily outer membrane receptor
VAAAVLTVSGLLCAPIVTIAAQQTQSGSITGRVTDQTTQLPLVGAQVFVVGTSRRVLTGADGQYRFDDVSPGSHEVQVRSIGYATVTKPVTVAPGEAVRLDIAVPAAALTLDALVVTASGEQQRAREVGNSVATLDASKIVSQAAPTNVSDLLTARAPGVQVLSSGGTTGTGARVRIRGASSLSLSNEPIIVVDGVRVESDPNSNSIGVGGQVPSRLNDINPDEIESIDIIKGPAAAALYGTDAANGVIQIRTKRGRPGPTKWSVYTEGGVLNDVTTWPGNYTAVTATGASCSLTGAASGACVIDTVRSFSPLETFSPFRQGVRQQYGVSASGGSEQTTFFLSGEFEREKGVYTSNNLRKVSLRANLTNQVSRLLDITASTGYVSSVLALPQNDNNALGIVSSGLLGSADSSVNKGYGFLIPSQVDNILTDQSVERFTGSLNANFRPLSFLTLRAVVGTDVTNRPDNQTFPPGKVPFNTATFEGQRTANRTQIFSWTANFTGTASFRPSPQITSNTSIGLQYYKNLFQQVRASGQKLVSGSGSLAGVVIPSVNETNTEFVTEGAYIEEQVGIKDRLFITGALRGDDNSAFGTNFNFITYPKLSVSWVVSEEPFFPQSSLLNSLRLRAAWGSSGRHPGPTDALQYFTPVAVAASGTDVPGITVGGLGNPSLRPEKTRELEMGFDADVVQQRLHLEFTYYNKNSRDALIERRLAPSLGVSTSRFENLGEVSNKGVEILLTGQLLNRPDLSWSFSASAWGNRNRLIHLGQGITPIIFGLGGASQRHAEGYPLGGYWDFPFTYNDANGDGLISTSEVTVGTAQVFQGSTLPTHGGTLSSEFNFRHFRLYGLLDGRWGNRLDNSTVEFRCLFAICRGRRDPTASLFEQARAVATVFNGLETGYYEDAGFVKLRELSLTYFAPPAWASRLGASTLTFTVTGRNLATWTKYTGVDPELNDAGQSNFNTADFLTQPPVRYFIARINLTF